MTIRAFSGLMARSRAARTTAATRINEFSSRSHALFIVIIEQTETVLAEDGSEEQRFRVGKLSLVDLAGSGE